MGGRAYIDHFLLLEKQRVAHAAVVIMDGTRKEVDVAAFHHFRAVGAADLAPVRTQEALVGLRKEALSTGLHGNGILTCKVT